MNADNKHTPGPCPSCGATRGCQCAEDGVPVTPREEAGLYLERISQLVREKNDLLEHIQDWIDNGDVGPVTLDRMRAAIARARGDK
jgi:hypothetical protein